MRTGVLNRVEAVEGLGVDDFLLAEVDEGADDGDIGAVKVGDRREGMELPRVEHAHEESLDGVVVVMGIGDLADAVLAGIAVHGPAAEERTGEARTLVVRLSHGAFDVNVDDIVRDAELLHEGTGTVNVKKGRLSLFVFEHRVDGQRGKRKFLVQPLLENLHRIGEEDAVLAAGDAEQDVVAILDHIELDDGAQQLAEIGLGEFCVHGDTSFSF